MAYIPRLGRISSYRLDNILSVETGKRCERFDEYREKLASMQGHIWGVSTGGGEELEHIDFTLRYGDEEEYIHRRLEREKRCGKVEKIDEHTSRFLAEVFDSYELIPWIRTFICRITDIHFSNPETEACFKADLKDMYRLYGLEGGEKNDF